MKKHIRLILLLALGAVVIAVCGILLCRNSKNDTTETPSTFSTSSAAQHLEISEKLLPIVTSSVYPVDSYYVLPVDMTLTGEMVENETEIYFDLTFLCLIVGDPLSASASVHYGLGTAETTRLSWTEDEDGYVIEGDVEMYWDDTMKDSVLTPIAVFLDQDMEISKLKVIYNETPVIYCPYTSSTDPGDTTLALSQTCYQYDADRDLLASGDSTLTIDFREDRPYLTKLSLPGRSFLLLEDGNSLKTADYEKWYEYFFSTFTSTIATESCRLTGTVYLPEYVDGVTYLHSATLDIYLAPSTDWFCIDLCLYDEHYYYAAVQSADASDALQNLWACGLCPVYTTEEAES